MGDGVRAARDADDAVTASRGRGSLALPWALLARAHVAGSGADLDEDCSVDTF